MPQRNTIKTYIENGYYHIYSRGVDKREIFLNEQDCATFLYYLKLYLSPPEILLKEKNLKPRIIYKITNLNLSKEIDLLSFSLMPNHFHLQAKQITINGIEKLMRRLLTAYAQYFNSKYKRIGTLFESAFKARTILSDEYNLYLSSYIHRNPISLKNPKLNFVQFSSYPYYLNEKKAQWLKTNELLSYFNVKKAEKSRTFSYEDFVQSFKEDPKEILGELILEDDY